MTRIIREKEFSNGVILQLIQGDITEVQAEGLVNPANRQLSHGGGLAGFLSHKAGPTLQKESNAWVANNGPVDHKHPAYTGAGDLPHRYIIHAVGPIWGSGSEAQKLSDAVSGSLRLANKLKLNSLVLPAISTGVFGYPLQEAAQVILDQLISYSKGQLKGSLSKLMLVVNDDNAADHFSAVWDQKEI
jgi:O-acetyl-ADP-ribose deacetylase (regulator of RNase III)